MSLSKFAFVVALVICTAFPELAQVEQGTLSSAAPRLVPRDSEKPSFDCAQAITPAARLICADAELAQLDGQLGVAFQKRKAQTPDQSKFVAEQLAWIRDRNTRCELVGKNSAAIEVLASSKPCMASAIRERTAALAQTRGANQVAALLDKRDPVTKRLPQDYANVAELPCMSLLSAEATDRFSSLSDPVADYIRQKASDFGSTANITDYILTECRLNENFRIGEAVDDLLEKKHHGSLPEIPIGGATDEPKVHADWDAFEKWLHHQGPRPHFGVGSSPTSVGSPNFRPQSSVGDNPVGQPHDLVAPAGVENAASLPAQSPSAPNALAAATAQSDPIVEWCTWKNSPLASSIAVCIEQSRRKGPALIAQLERELKAKHEKERYQAEAAERVKAVQEQGYRPISFNDFKLDGKQLAATQAKVTTQGFYQKLGEIEILQPSGLAVAIARKYGNDSGIPLLTEDASRSVRAFFLQCRENILAQLGCPFTVVGHADVCTMTSLSGSKSIACLAVEDGW